MSEGLSDRTASGVTGALGLVFSLAYIAKANSIEDSLLADAVGASGVPVGIGSLMAAASAVLLVKALMPVASKQVADAAGRGDGTTHVAQTPEKASLRPHLLAAGLVAILVAYMLVLPLLGYVVSIGLMAAAVAWFAGGREAKTLLGFALLTGPLLWFLFDFALKVRMPAGMWSTLFTG